MKTIHILFLIMSVLLVSCQQEEPTTDVQQQDLTENWKKVAPEKVFESAENGFNISKEALEKALSLPKVSTVRFILEVENKQLQIRVVGADQNENTTKGIVAKPVSLQKVVDKLFEEKSTSITTATLSKSVASHILQPNEATVFISRWQQQFSNKTLSEAIAYDGERIQYFSMPAAVAKQMLQSRSKSINMVWGVNPKGKFTTVFLPEIDKENSLLKSGDFIFEYLTPCPPTCVD